MSGELNEALERPDFEIIYDSGLRPDPGCSRDVLAFVLTPVEVMGVIHPEEMEAACALFLDAKREAIAEWQRRRRVARPG